MNQHVKSWQRRLNLEGANIIVDGDFGKGTLKASVDLADEVEPDKTAMETVGKGVEAPKSGPWTRFKLPNVTRVVKEIIWHCAATREGRDYTVKQIDSWHRKRGWSGIGYHFVVYRDGSIHLGRNVNKTGAHVRGRNTGTIGCCYIGGVASDGKTAKDTRTPEQKAAMLWLTAQFTNKYPKIKRISGHREFSAKACPSFDVRTDLLGNSNGFQNGRRK